MPQKRTRSPGAITLGTVRPAAARSSSGVGEIGNRADRLTRPRLPAPRSVGQPCDSRTRTSTPPGGDRRRAFGRRDFSGSSAATTAAPVPAAAVSEGFGTNIVAMLGTMLTGGSGPAALAVGTVVYFTIGIVFALIFALVIEPLVQGPKLVEGLGLGFVAFALAMATMPLMAAVMGSSGRSAASGNRARRPPTRAPRPDRRRPTRVRRPRRRRPTRAPGAATPARRTPARQRPTPAPRRRTRALRRPIPAQAARRPARRRPPRRW